MARSNSSSSSAGNTGTEHIPRPSNKFLIYRSKRAKEIAKENETKGLPAIDQGTLSKMIAKEWKFRVTDDEKENIWGWQAALEDWVHKQKYPGYTFDPKKKDKNGKKTTRKKNPKANTASSATMPQAVGSSQSNDVSNELPYLFEFCTPTTLPPVQKQAFATEPVRELRWVPYARRPIESDDSSVDTESSTSTTATHQSHHCSDSESVDSHRYPTPAAAANELAYRVGSATNSVPSYYPQESVQASQNQYQNPGLFTSAGAGATVSATSHFNQPFLSSQWVAPSPAFSNTTAGLAAPNQPEPVYESSPFQFSARPRAQQSTSAWESLHPQTYERVDWDAILPTDPGLLSTSSLDATVYAPAFDNYTSTAGVDVASDSEPIYPDASAQFVPPTTVRPQDLHTVGGYPFNWHLNNAPSPQTSGGYDVSVDQLQNELSIGQEYFGLPILNSSSLDGNSGYQYTNPSTSSYQNVDYGFMSQAMVPNLGGSLSFQPWGDFPHTGFESYSEAPSSPN
ncbi:hypothetical protein BDQ17DRAFT_1427681 [Cyathus striatus]|nr:hypothetical protein BDQ17DRAFT_1427681 [Cyathus striatus]